MYDVYSIREDFPVLREVIYLDSAATSQKPVQVADAVSEYFKRYCGNYGRGAHRLSKMTTEKYEDAREDVASFLGLPAKKSIFTRNATESINMVALGMDWKKGDNIITAVVEHHSNLLPWIRLREKGVEVTIVDSDDKGIVSPASIEEAITERTRLIAIGHVSNFFGSVQDIKSISKIAKKHGVKFLVDAAQSAGEMQIDFRGLDIDFLCLPGHKGLLGPQGTGILYIREPERLSPVYVGGGTIKTVTLDEFSFDEIPSRFEYGTPNIPGVIGLGRAVNYVKDIGVESIESHLKAVSGYCVKRLSEIPQVEIYGPENRGSLVSFNVRNVNPHDAAMILDETKKICVRSGQHCAQTALARLCISGSIRASFGCYTTMEEIDALAESVEMIAKAFS
ncbi:cysteine desulfurase [Methanocella sp. CWC-04]|uniref:cysteine desulfurase n=1 Tax=Methanooceanicella nereidis TaxID=2052831 RepID=A0AAP2W781_9EURY|nr:cysteine desulfurase [Methanocella sp. CWC-04]MCD1296127.1 cysteine desulfurase [Methanocella sp. CWC-04]